MSSLGRRYALLRLVHRTLPVAWQRGAFAEPGFRGYASIRTSDDGALVEGWVLAEDRRELTGIEVQGVATLASLRLGISRPDVARELPGFPTAQRSGFEVALDGRGGEELRLLARFADGTTRTCFRTRLPQAPPAPRKTAMTATATTNRRRPARPLALFADAVAAASPRLVVAVDAAPSELTALRVLTASAERPVALYVVDPDAPGDLVEDAWLTVIREEPSRASRRFTAGTIDLLVVADDTEATLAPWRRALAPHTRVVGPLAHAAAPPAPAPPVLPTSDTPEVSVVIPVHGRWELTRRCLTSIAAFGAATPFEVIVVDDASPDETAAELARVRGVRVVTNAENLGFGDTCNRGAEAARGRFVLFLNNDTVVTPGWLDALRRTFDDLPAIGIAGGKLVLEDGTLQEAGSIVFRDGSAANVGRGADPDRPEYDHLRDVDYVSGALLVVEKELFTRLGGFDPLFAPAYYEDVDLAFRVRAAGLRVVYQPLARVLHREGGTNGTDVTRGTKRYQILNQGKLAARWGEVLARHAVAPLERREALVEHAPRPRLLVVDHTTPRPDFDSGSMRMAALLRLITEAGVQVTFFADDRRPAPEHEAALRAIGVEVIAPRWAPSLAAHLSQVGARYDAVLLSRRDPARHNAATVRRLAPRARVIFDTVDLHFVREERGRTLGALAAGPTDPGDVRDAELALARAADATIVVSDEERTVLTSLGVSRPIHVLGNVHAPSRAAVPPFAARRDLVFVGFFLHAPNVDGMVWFLDEVFPIVRARATGVRLHVVGSDAPPELRARARAEGDAVVMHGHVADVVPLLDAARVSIAPLRFGAGVKGKVTQAMSRGLPVATTTIGAEGLGATSGRELLVADSPDALAAAILALYDDAALWERVSQAARAHAEATTSPDGTRPRIAALFSSLGLERQP